jgi:hypothetical protein
MNSDALTAALAAADDLAREVQIADRTGRIVGQRRRVRPG